MSNRTGFFKSNREQVNTWNHFTKPEKLKLEIEAKLKETKKKISICLLEGQNLLKSGPLYCLICTEIIIA